MQGRRYLRRVHRVAKDQGAAIYLAALIKKMMRKHGWPADVLTHPLRFDSVIVVHVDGFDAATSDFWVAYEMCCRNIAYTHSIDLDICPDGLVMFVRSYVVRANFFKRI